MVEEFLINQAKAVMVISHDRAFVDILPIVPLKLQWKIYDYKKQNIQTIWFTSG